MAEQLPQVSPLVFQCAPDVVWMSAPDGIRVEAVERGLSLTLGYPQAALWDFVVRGVGEVRAIGMMRHIGGFADESATFEFVARSVREWQQQGLIVPR
jgi:hypothetical protein